MEPTGRLELTWANKHVRLISDPEGGYEWVDPADPRVSEVRLLQEVDTVGNDSPDGDNLLIEGDALHALTALNRIPELEKRYVGQVRLVYIDPPFNTGQAFAHYDDNLEHSVWLSMLRDRLVQLKWISSCGGAQRRPAHGAQLVSSWDSSMRTARMAISRRRLSSSRPTTELFDGYGQVARFLGGFALRQLRT